MSQEEKSVASTVQLSASELRPADDYSLSLYGLNVPRTLKRTLEQQFDIPLHRDMGASITLTTDKLTGELYAKQVSIPTSREGMAHLYHTEQLGYIPSLDRKASLPIHAYSKEEIMDLLAIKQPESYELSVYHPWKSNLLKETEAWRLKEGVEMIDRIVDQTGYSIRIENNEHVGAPGDESYRKTMSVSRNISTRLGDSREQISSFSVEVELDNYEAALRAFSSFCIKKSASDLLMIEDDPEVMVSEQKDTRDKDVLSGARKLSEKALYLLREKYSA